MNKHIALAAIAAVIAFASPAQAADPRELSAAEKLLFMNNHLGSLPRSTTLEYTFSKRGTLEDVVDDKARLIVGRPAPEGGRPVKVEFLTDARRIELPDIGAARGNPIILYFLEREVREMHRLTGGSANYYRKRIRMALAQGGQVEAVNVDVGPRTLKATQIRIAPYRDDPARPRYEKLAEKTYVFTLSDGVPGTVVEMRSELLGRPNASSNAPETIIVETLRFAGER